jgi:hypothetical protein
MDEKTGLFRGGAERKFLTPTDIHSVLRILFNSNKAEKGILAEKR